MTAGRDELGLASSIGDGQTQRQIGWRQIVARAFRPFDEADSVALEVFIEPCIKVFFRLVESIEIKVVQV